MLIPRFVLATNGLSHSRWRADFILQPLRKRRLGVNDDDVPIKEEPGTNSAKRRKLHEITPRKPKLIRRVNSAPTRRLDIAVFGNGENGELGLGHKWHDKTSPENASKPRLNHFLDADHEGVVQVAVGGMLCAALTHDGRVLTWGVNDSRALGRNTHWEPPAQLDENSTWLNPLESTPAPAEGLDGLESGIAQVAVTDNATFVLTESGLVYGWGTFIVFDTPDYCKVRRLTKSREVTAFTASCERRCAARSPNTKNGSKSCPFR
jgi:alpha-tubulin suppressor-like RCC1 family protein